MHTVNLANKELYARCIQYVQHKDAQAHVPQQDRDVTSGGLTLCTIVPFLAFLSKFCTILEKLKFNRRGIEPVPKLNQCMEYNKFSFLNGL